MSVEKGCLLLFFSLLFSCCTCSPARWYLDKPCRNSGRVYYPAKSSEIAIEIIRSCGSDWCYVNNSTFGFQSSPPILITIKGECFTFQGECLEGFQRVLLPTQATQLLIKALIDGHSVGLTVGDYQTTLEPWYFSEHYSRLNFTLF